MKKIYALLFTCLFVLAAKTYAAGDTARVLFIGNSFTYVNDLPEVLKGLATASGDVLIKDQNTPAGWTFEQHSTDPATIALIQQGNWDYVVLQEQSQRPAFGDGQVAQEVFPYAKILDSLVHKYNSCAKTIFYMTWGRKNGDASNCAVLPPICTYYGMDSMLRLRYTMMADDNNALLCPAGWVWNRIRLQYPGINLYDVDEIHPSPQGTFIAACSFYSMIFHKNPASNSYNFSLSSTEATQIKQQAKLHCYDSLTYWQRFASLTHASFTKAVNGHGVNFTNASQNALSYLWLFGDGGQSTSASPSHTYTNLGLYTVKLVAKRCNETDTVTQQVNIIGNAGVAALYSNDDVNIYPNPATESMTIQAPFKIETLAINDMMGRKIIEYKDAKGLTQINDLGTLNAGVYILCINGQYYRQFIKK
jgi:hypothetical protein